MDGGQHIICVHESEDETYQNLLHCNGGNLRFTENTSEQILIM